MKLQFAPVRRKFNERFFLRLNFLRLLASYSGLRRKNIVRRIDERLGYD